MSNAIEFLTALAHQMQHQHNAYTSYPIFTVEEHRMVTGLDTEYIDQIGWFDAESGSLAEGEEAQLLEAAYQETGEFPDDWHRTGYDCRWEQIASFFTRTAAEDFIERQQHNHRMGLRVYVESGYRNNEWKELRRLLSGPVADCVVALQEVTAELQQLHAHHYQHCQGGCPAQSAIHMAQNALNDLNDFQDPYR